jgi:iron-sulfur cluster assembly protein
MTRDPITITDSAYHRIKALLDSRGKASAGIKINVVTKGCSGMKYKIEYADEISKFDVVVKKNDVNILIDGKAMLYIIGSEMDYLEEELSSGFTFKNPNEKGKCGCGESFHV